MYSIAIDGPAGAGKTTMAKLVAKILGFLYVDTGAMYRTIALAILRNGWSVSELTSAQMAQLHIEIEVRDGEQHMILDGEDVTGLLRTEEVSMMASTSSALPLVRARLLSMQQSIAKTTRVVMEGRDIGTVVLPQATLKVFLTAAPHVRAYRRMLQMGAKPEEQEEILASIQKRDLQDSTRQEAPLKKADGAVVIDNSEMTIKEVQTAILSAFQKKEHGYELFPLDEKAKLFLCKNHCGSNFYGTQTVQQNLEVDAFGRIVRSKDDAEIIQKFSDNAMTCPVCKDPVRPVFCSKISVRYKGKRVGDIYVDPTDNFFFYAEVGRSLKPMKCEDGMCGMAISHTEDDVPYRKVLYIPRDEILAAKL